MTQKSSSFFVDIIHIKHTQKENYERQKQSRKFLFGKLFTKVKILYY